MDGLFADEDSPAPGLSCLVSMTALLRSTSQAITLEAASIPEASVKCFLVDPQQVCISLKSGSILHVSLEGALQRPCQDCKGSFVAHHKLILSVQRKIVHHQSILSLQRG